jgi:hypothetical protein
LPVVLGDGRVIGSFSYRSFAAGVLELEGENKVRAETLTVADFVEQLSFADLGSDVEQILAELDRDDALLVGTTHRIVGIATPMDVLRYFYRVASAFLMLQEIEHAIRELIRCSLSDAERGAAIARLSSTSRFPPATEGRLEDLSFGHYVQLVENKTSWEELNGAFGASRESAVARLRATNELRNDAFHFRRELEPDDYERLVRTRAWLRIRLQLVAGRAQGREAP